MNIVLPKFSAYDSEEGIVILSIEEGPFSGCDFSLGRVAFADKENDDGSIDLEIDYTLVDTPDSFNEEKFRMFLGDFLLTILEEQLAKNEVVYTGGVDET